MFGTAVFTIGSLMAGLSHDLNTLIVSRAIEGIGGAAAMANNQGIITEVFPASERGRALGISGISVALGTMLGPPIGGLIVSSLSWNYIFLINVPVGIVGFLLALRLLPRGTKTKQKVDTLGAVTLAAAVILFFYALLSGQNVGYDRYYIILAFVGCIVLFALFIWFEKKSKQPIVDLSLFKNSLFTISIVCVLIQFFAMSGISIIQPFYIEDVLKIDPGQTGLIMMSFPIVMGIMSPLSGYISDKVGAAKITLVGLVVMTAGLYLLSTCLLYTSHHQIEASADLFQKIPLYEAFLLPRNQCGRVFPRHAERIARAVREADRFKTPFRAECHAEHTAPAAQVENSLIPIFPRRAERAFRHAFGIVTRDQYPFVNIKRPAVKILFAQHIRERLP